MLTHRPGGLLVPRALWAATRHRAVRNGDVLRSAVRCFSRLVFSEAAGQRNRARICGNLEMNEHSARWTLSMPLRRVVDLCSPLPSRQQQLLHGGRVDERRPHHKA
jgi:hypothetical protein